MDKNIKLGNDVKTEDFVVLGESSGKSGNPGELFIGDNSLLRSGTVIYYGVRAGNSLQTGHNAVIREGNILGDNVVIGVNSYLGPGNKIGNNVVVHTSCFLEDAVVEDNVIFGPHVTLLNDPHPRCPRYKECVGGVKIKKGARIGANVTILPGVTIGERALVGAGSVVTKDVPPGAVVVGNPAKIVKKVNELICEKGFYEKVYEWEKR